MISRAMSLLTVLCLSTLLIASADAQRRVKPEKTDKPDQSTSEWIEFSGDLSGGQEVTGCCPNAGPFPEYTMTLSSVFVGAIFGEEEVYDDIDGHLFINRLGVPKDRTYLVQFWFNILNEDGNEEEIFIEVRGGFTEYDRKTETLYAYFDSQNSVCRYYFRDEENTIEDYEFELLRYPSD